MNMSTMRVIKFHCHTGTPERPEVETIEHVSVLYNICTIHVQYMYVLIECTTDHQQECVFVIYMYVDGLSGVHLIINNYNNFITFNSNCLLLFRLLKIDLYICLLFLYWILRMSSYGFLCSFKVMFCTQMCSTYVYFPLTESPV